MEKEIFHVHTFRCGHAEMIPDEAYVEEAIKLGAETITFTDHAPFPDNPFKNGMNYNDLQEYVSTLQNLKRKYTEKINIKIGLEVEYLPSYLTYYRELKESREFDLLVIGQHFYEVEPDKYSFSLKDKKGEYIGITNAIEQGIKTGLFDVVAHPDRSFRREKEWTYAMAKQAEKVIRASAKTGIPLERNYSSMRKKHQYWNEFWELASKHINIICGCDAHFITDLQL